MIHIKDTLKKILYNPVVLVLLIPASYLMLGTIYALQYTSLNWTIFLLLYGFLFINYYIENYFSKYLLFSKQAITPKILVLELLNIAIIATISFSSNYLVSILIILYSLMIHFQYTLKLFNLAGISIAILSFFKGGILTYLSFFVQILFVPLELFKWSIPLILLNLCIELGKYFLQPVSTQQKNKNRSSLILLLVALTYITSILFLYTSFQYLLWLLLLTVPFTLRFVKLFHPIEEKSSKGFRLKTICIFQIFYLFTFALIESLYFYLL
ncbi:hypothetical protein JTF06_14290 [Desemzia sp. RIT804]|uniref:hypothetical protein n=1 Tax=Desemzia sp. RIT 804 TaxID=2810209 RepID=UPI00195163DD|nr:hypothetical protein [Desemzia sp. RIT 804]MBM6616058.1 hypothetical protein [Desemzia sp. RIT 804]